MRNEKCVLASMLVLLLSGASGCIFVNDDDGVVTDGVFRTAWDVTSGNSQINCADVGAEKDSFLFTAETFGDGFDELFDCDAFAGQTSPLPIDDYTYVASLLDCPNNLPGCPDGVTLAASDPLQDTLNTCNVISGGICFVDLPLIDFTF